MNLLKYEYLWKDEQDKYVLVKGKKLFSIINRECRMMLVIEDDRLAEEIANEMLKHGNEVFDTIMEAYESVGHK